jgi:uncharacterized membrane protein
MSTTYNLFKFLHVVAVIVWLGGLITVGLINARAARATDRKTLAELVRQSRWHGVTVIAPSAAIALIAGVVLVATSPLEFRQLWIAWGFAAIAASIALGATAQRRTGTELGQRLEAAEPDDGRVFTLQRRLARLNVVNALLLLSAVWAMVFKPTL